MPLPASLARFNRRATNTLTRPVAGRLPGFAVVTHRGRRSGAIYRTPVNAFATPDGYVVALTYGPDRDWVKNVLAAGGGVLEVGGRRVRVERPRLVHDPRRRLVPAPVRPMLRLLGVEDFLELGAARAASDRPAQTTSVGA
jgi:deazaflavin-dependent oxidoreductase (nitroreductase family)